MLHPALGTIGLVSHPMKSIVMCSRARLSITCAGNIVQWDERERWPSATSARQSRQRVLVRAPLRFIGSLRQQRLVIL